MAESVKVIVRCRPVNEREERLQCDVVVSIDTDIMQIQLTKPKSDGPPKLFTFDGVYNMADTTQHIYDDICFPLVANVLEGYNGTVFAYGQTGCGKSYTMVGVDDPPEQVGIIPRAFDHIFDHIAVTEDTKFMVTSSYLEIYNEEVRDLLGKDVKKKLDLKEHPEKGVYVAGLSSKCVHNRKELEHVMSIGSKNRSMGATLMNVDSSRSHCIFTIDIEMMTTAESGGIVSGRLNLVDLAGSERQSKTGATGDRLKEATKINLSLSALGNVISALVDGKSKHIPYRDSKLTRLLQSSLGGNTKTLMIACISPADNNYDETLSTLRYANRAKNIKNKPKINEDPKDALLREYQEEIKRLKMMLTGQIGVPDSLKGASNIGRDYDSEIETLRANYEAKISELQAQYGQEQSNRSKLEEEMAKLKSEYELQLTKTTRSKDNIAIDKQMTAAIDDEKILQEHEVAIQKLTSLQEGLIGGEKIGDTALKQQLESRKQYAEDRLSQVKKANSFLDDDDGILERIFNNLTDEVRLKTRALERTQNKLKSAEDEINDLQTEFEVEREDMLEIIRTQERQLLLHKQLLDKIVPLIRRDCNYYNLDKVKSECKYSEDNEEWILPKVITTSVALSTVTSKTSLTGASSPRIGKKGTADDINVGSSQGTGGKWQEGEQQQISKMLSNKTDSTNDYFKPKRAQELLAECSMIKGSPVLERSYGGVNKSPSHVSTSSSSTSQNGSSTSTSLLDVTVAAADTKLKPPRKLDSISHYKSTNIAPPPADTSTIEQLDRMIALKKGRQFDPLNDHTRKQF